MIWHIAISTNISQVVSNHLELIRLALHVGYLGEFVTRCFSPHGPSEHVENKRISDTNVTPVQQPTTRPESMPVLTASPSFYPTNPPWRHSWHGRICDDYHETPLAPAK